MTATNTSPICMMPAPVYMMTDPNPSTEEEMLNALASAAQADSMEDLFRSIREITLVTSYCRVPLNSDFHEIDRKAGTWNETQALMEQCLTAATTPDPRSGARCRLGCCR